MCVCSGRSCVPKCCADARVNDLSFNSKLCVLITNVFSSLVNVSVYFLLDIRVRLFSICGLVGFSYCKCQCEIPVPVPVPVPV